MGFFERKKNLIFIVVCLVTIALAALSSFNWVVPAVLIAVIDYYLFWLMLTSARLSTRNLIKDYRKEWLLKFFPGRIMGFLLFIILLAATAYMFSTLYYDFKADYCYGKSPLGTRLDAFCMSIGTITTVSIVNFSATTDLAKWLLMAQQGSDILLFISAFPLLLSRISNFEDKLRHERLPYNKKLRGTSFNEFNLERLTGIPANTWAEFSGLFTDTIPEVPIEKKDFNFDGSYPLLKMTANHLGDDNHFSFDFDLELGLIHVGYFIIKTTSNRTATRAFIRFLRLSTEAGFKTVDCTAARQANIKDYVGYSVWGKFGFTMKPDSQKDFDNYIKSRGWNEKTLIDLLNAPNGEVIWLREGFDWQGIFDLAPKSKNRQIWEKYLSKVIAET